MRSRLFRFWLLVALPLGLFSKEAIIPLAEVKPGMQGIWKTVVSGREIREYRLEVVDIMYGLMAPGVPTIFCKALDEDQIHIGTVAGMSGSPVYIEGKLAGAYALGFPFPKDQALIGVTPIENMLGILDFDEDTSSSVSSKPHAYLGAQGPQACMPLFMPGVPEKTIHYLNASLPQLGFRAVSAAGSSAPSADKEAPSVDHIAGGSAIAPVLLGGDFLWGGVGTVTTREGDTLLAFGHPFFDAGPVDVPFAEADIITIVQNYASSFKLPKIGKVIGSLTQDKLTGVLGKLGRKPNTIACTFNLSYPDGSKKTYQGDLCRFWGLSPLIFGGALHSVLTESLGAQMKQTFFMHTRFEFDDKPTIDLEDVGSGEEGVQWLPEITERRYGRLMENPFEAAPLKSVTFDIKVQNGWFDQKLYSVELLGDRTEPGDT
ncbi:MAG TPA: hypothetical protein DIU37_01930, partial [Opitutae bacterium]|nr:hypothetical protein [Opitutae bacterium]